MFLFAVCSQAALTACDNLLANIESVLPGGGDGMEWADKVSLANSLGADLTGRHQ